MLEENARQRDRVIAKKEECDRRREEEVRAYQAVVAQRVQKEREARDRAQAVRAAHSQSKIDETMALKERLIRQEELGRRREAKRLQQVQKRVVEARSLDDRLDESEEALQAAQRQMSVVDKKKLAAAEGTQPQFLTPIRPHASQPPSPPCQPSVRSAPLDLPSVPPWPPSLWPTHTPSPCCSKNASEGRSREKELCSEGQTGPGSRGWGEGS